MPFENEPDTTASSLLSKRRNGVGATLPKASQNIPKKNALGSKPKGASKTSCICAPTTHVGSFRCHLHRRGAAQKLSWKLLEDTDSNGRTQSFNTNTEYRRAALTQHQHLSELNKEEHPSEVLNSSQVNK